MTRATLLFVAAATAVTTHAQDQPQPYDFSESAAYDWNMNDSIWNDTLRFTIAEDNGVFRAEKLYEHDTAGWEVVSGTEIYRTDDRLDSLLTYSINAFGYKVYERKTVQLYEGGYLKEHRIYTFEYATQLWSLLEKTIWTRVGDGSPATRTQHGLVIVNGQYEVLPVDTAVFIYDTQGQLDSIVNWEVDGTALDTSFVVVFDHNGNGELISETRYNYVFGSLLNGERLFYSYNAQGLVEEVQTQSFVNGQYVTHYSQASEYESGSGLMIKQSEWQVDQSNNYNLTRFFEFDFQSDTLVESRVFGNQFWAGNVVVGIQRLTYDYSYPADTTDTTLSVNPGPLQPAMRLSIYPNPSSDVVTIAGDGQQSLQEVEVFNTHGQRVMTMRPGGAAIARLNIGELPAGNYLYRILLSDGGSQTGIIQRQ